MVFSLAKQTILFASLEKKPKHKKNISRSPCSPHIIDPHEGTEAKCFGQLRRPQQKKYLFFLELHSANRY